MISHYIVRLLTMPIFIVFWAISVLASEPGVAETKEQTDPSTPVHITSDSVKSDHNMRWVEFIGNARAAQQDVVITADSIKIFYKPGGDTAEVTSSIERSFPRAMSRSFLTMRRRRLLQKRPCILPMKRSWCSVEGNQQCGRVRM